MMGSRFGLRVPERQVFGDSSLAKMGIGRGKESGVAAEGGEESKRGVKRRRAGELQSGDGGESKAPGKKRRQPKKGVVLGADG
jgi:hypothetical protein